MSEQKYKVCPICESDNVGHPEHGNLKITLMDVMVCNYCLFTCLNHHWDSIPRAEPALPLSENPPATHHVLIGLDHPARLWCKKPGGCMAIANCDKDEWDIIKVTGTWNDAFIYSIKSLDDLEMIEEYEILYKTWKKGERKPLTMPKGCEVYADTAHYAWMRESNQPDLWCDLDRRWPVIGNENLQYEVEQTETLELDDIFKRVREDDRLEHLSIGQFQAFIEIVEQVKTR